MSDLCRQYLIYVFSLIALSLFPFAHTILFKFYGIADYKLLLSLCPSLCYDLIFFVLEIIYIVDNNIYIHIYI